MKKMYALLIAIAITSSGFSQNTPTNLHLKIKATIGTGVYHTDFYFNENSSSGIDRGYDAAVFNNTAQPIAVFSRLADGSYNTIDFAIQSLHTSVLGSDIVVPLGINVPTGQQVIISIEESNLPSDIGIVMEDWINGTSGLLNDGNYTFTPDTTLNGVGHFCLKFNGQTLSTQENNLESLKIYSDVVHNRILVKGAIVEMAAITLYDLQGRSVLSSTLEPTADSSHIDVSRLQAGMYLVLIKNDTQQKTQKVVIR